MATENNNEVLQKKAYEFETLRQQLAGIDAELQELNVRIGEFERAKATLNGIKDCENNSELMIPLGEGLFIKSFIKNVDEVFIGVGSNTVIGKNIKDANDYVQERINEADNLINRLSKNAEYFVQRMRELEPELQRLTNELKK